jgi:hypothetical protein
MKQSDEDAPLDKALRLVWEWKEANDLRFLSPRTNRDLADRIERPIREARGELVGREPD